MIQKIKKHYFIFLELLFLLFLSLTPLLWFSTGKIVFGLDSGYPIDFIGYFLQRSFTWLSSVDFGVNMTTYIGLLPFHGIQASLSYIGLPFYSIQKVTFIFWFFVMSFSMYLFVYYLYPQKNFWILRLTTVIAYVFNLYLFIFWLNGEQPTFSAYSLLPILMLILFKFFRNELSPLKAALFVNIAFFFLSAGGITGVPLLGSSIISIITIFVLFVITTPKKMLGRFLKSLGKFLLFSGIFFVFINAYWLLPFIAFFRHQFDITVAVNGGGVGANVSWLNFISRYDSYLNLFRLQGDNNWYNHPGFYSNNYFINPLLIIGSLLFPVLSYSSILFVREKKEKFVVVFLILLSLVAILFSAGSHPPFGFVYVYMMNHIPGFVAFRSAYYKFVITLYFAFSILFGISTYYILEKFVKAKLKIVFWIILVIGLLLYNYPFFQKSNFVFNAPFSTMMKVPQYVFDFKSFENNHANDYRTLVLPPENKDYPLSLYKWGYFSASALFSQLTRNTFLYDRQQLSGDDRSLVDQVYSLLKNKKYDEFLHMANMLNIHEILITNDVVTNYGSSVMEPPSVYKNAIESSKLFSVVWHEGQWTLYRLNSAKGKEISVSMNVNTYKGDIPNLSTILSFSNKLFISSGNNQNIASYNLPTVNSIAHDDCVSCIIFADNIELANITTLVNPGSFLYQVKRWREDLSLSKATTLDEKTQLLLSLSVKRMTELTNITIPNTEKTTIIDWQPITDALNSYFTSLNNISSTYINQDDFAQLKMIHSYFFMLQSGAENIYDSAYAKSNIDFRKAFANVLWKQQELSKNINNFFSEYILQGRYTYNVNNLSPNQVISIPLSSLPMDREGNYETPISYDKDGTIFSPKVEVRNQQFILSSIPQNSHFISLHFNPAFNYAANAKVTNIALPNKTQRCLLIPLDHYIWENSYLIYIKKEAFKDNPVDLYIVATYPPKMGKSSNQSGFFHYDAEYQFYSDYPFDKLITFTGNQDYTGVTIYTCIDNSSASINTLVTNMIVSRLFHPKLFSETFNNVDTTTTTPEVSFKKINPTEYSVTIIDAKSPFLLTFLEKYSDLWKIYDSNNHEIILPHVVVDGYANGWYISKLGSYTLYLRFLPQQFFTVGLWITSITLFATVVALSIRAFFLKRI